MKKLACVLCLLYLFFCSSFAYAKTPKLLFQDKFHGVNMYGEEKNDIYKNFVLQTKGKQKTFSKWSNVTNATYAPQVYFSDLNHDNQKEIIVILTTGQGTGFHESKVHILHPETLKEYKVESPLSVLDKRVKTEIDRGKVDITIDGKPTSYALEKYGIHPSHLLEEIELGNRVHYNVVRNRLVTIIDTKIALGSSIGSFLLTYEYNESAFKIDAIEFQDYYEEIK